MSARFSVIRSNEIEYSMWLVFDEDGGVRLTRAEPALGRNERGMAVNAKLPRSLWRTPQLSATIAIAGGEVPRPTIDISAAESALKSVLGVDIDLQIRDAS